MQACEHLVTIRGACTVDECADMLLWVSGNAGRIEVLAMAGMCGLAVSGVQAVALEGHQLLAVSWSWQVQTVPYLACPGLMFVRSYI